MDRALQIMIEKKAKIVDTFYQDKNSLKHFGALRACEYPLEKLEKIIKTKEELPLFNFTDKLLLLR